MENILCLNLHKLTKTRVKECTDSTLMGFIIININEVMKSGNARIKFI